MILAFLAGLTAGVGFYELAGWAARRRRRSLGIHGHPSRLELMWLKNGQPVLASDRSLTPTEIDQLREKWRQMFVGPAGQRIRIQPPSPGPVSRLLG